MPVYKNYDGIHKGSCQNTHQQRHSEVNYSLMLSDCHRERTKYFIISWKNSWGLYLCLFRLWLSKFSLFIFRWSILVSLSECPSQKPKKLIIFEQTSYLISKISEISHWWVIQYLTWKNIYFNKSLIYEIYHIIHCRNR